MHWFWFLLGGYLVFCAAGWLLSMWICPGQARELLDDDRIQRALRKHPIRMRLVLLTMALLLVPLFPLVFGYSAWSCWQEDREWQRFRRTYRPVQFEAVHPANLPAEAREHFDQCTPVVERLGFDSAVTCQLKPPPRPVLARCLLSRDGATVADIAWIFGSPALSFVSVLDGGHVLETACMAGLPPDDFDRTNSSGRYTAQWRELGRGWSFNDELFLLAAYRGHQERLAELERQLDRGVLVLAADQIPALRRYENAVYGQLLFELNRVDNCPQPQPCPQGTPRRIGETMCETGARRCASWTG